MNISCKIETKIFKKLGYIHLVFEIISRDKIDEVIKSKSKKIPVKGLSKSTFEEIKERLGRYHEITKTFIIERNYVDREWREEYSLFYSTTFHEEIGKFATRIHLISEDVSDVEDVEERNYLGYIVLRPDIVPLRVLKIILKPIKEFFGVRSGEEMYLCTCTFTPHLGGREFKIETFPFYSQDSMVTVCAHASVWMVLYYLYKKFNMNRPYLRNLVAHIPPYHGRVIPSEALDTEQIVLSLVSNGYAVSLKAFSPTESESCVNRVEAYLESGLPTILLFDDHAVVVAGHTLNDGEERDWIIYDDSGHHLKRFEGTNQFAYRVEKEKIKRRIENSSITLIGKILENSLGLEVVKDKTPNVLTVNIEFERLYFPIESVYDAIKRVFEEKLKIVPTKRVRVLLVNSSRFKSLCRKNGVLIFENVHMPHYIWLIEFYDDNNELTAEMIIDAAAHKFDVRFGSCIMALWDYDQINLYRPYKKFIKVKPPIQFSNLERVKSIKELELGGVKIV